MQSRTREGDPELNEKRVLITGSNGVVGVPLCKELWETWHVRAGVRPRCKGSLTCRSGADPARCDGA
jgi:nucleoside-diphosphate-sugar epimerase